MSFQCYPSNYLRTEPSYSNISCSGLLALGAVTPPKSPKTVKDCCYIISTHKMPFHRNNSVKITIHISVTIGLSFSSIRNDSETATSYLFGNSQKSTFETSFK